MAPGLKGRGCFRFLVVGAFAALLTGCDAPDEVAPPSSARPDSKPVGSRARSNQGGFVGTRGRVKSSKYVMDFVLGQSTQNQDESASRSYLVRGGFIGGKGGAQ